MNKYKVDIKISNIKEQDYDNVLKEIERCLDYVRLKRDIEYNIGIGEPDE